ncbi:Rne/Rng family ribonuclease [Williamsia muralis]|uniref:Ribonuclease E n=1 Tax=Williamsia marianensis TaxID=85044 RepID=A0A2G3PFK1_WILMA|nr:Rne/Rng family ribonuclease [Williamsia marianensis]PHV64581.1 ribonuclease E [Williamsia marianensis]
MADTQSPDELNSTGSAQEFPHKLRVHALARILGLSSREVLAHLAELGIAARSPQSSIVRSTAIAVRDRINPPADESVEGDDAITAGADSPLADPQPVEAEQSAEVSAARVAEPESENVAPPVDSEVAAAATAPSEDAPAEAEPADKAPESVPRERSIPSLFSAVEEEQPRHTPTTSAGAGAGSPLFLSAEQSAPIPQSTKDSVDADADTDTDDSDDESESGSRKRRRGRRGRGRGRGDQAGGDFGDDDSDTDATDSAGEPARETQDGASADSDDAPDTDDEAAKPETRSGNRRKRSRPKKARPDSDGDNEQGPDGSPSDAPADETAGGDDDDSDQSAESDSSDSDDQDDSGDGTSANRRRRRRRRRKGGEGDEPLPADDPPNTVVHEREPRNKSRGRDEVQGISGSTRLEAKRQRRRDGRDAGRRRPPILSESEFLARREAVDRVMVVRERSGVAATVTHGDTHSDGNAESSNQQTRDYTQVAVLEDGVLVEHFVTTSNSSSMVGNIYLGRVQNVLPGMEAAFVDIGRGRNGVLYAGEVNWDAAGLDGGSRKIEQALRPGDQVLVQVSKDPVGHKGARLTTQISLAGRYLVYVPGGGSTGISRKLPDTERKRLKQILGKIVPDDAGVIIRTASEGVSAEELTADIERLQQQWETINTATSAAGSSKSGAPQTLYEEPDLLVKVVRDLFNEDFKKLIVEGNGAWNQVENYVRGVAPDLLDRTERFEKAHADAPDVFDVHRIDEQLAKALDRKVWLPSGGTLIIEHTEAMTVVDVNTGKFTGSGGNLEETVTRNNLEAAEEIVRQMRLRDIGGMIVVDFIDMVLESNRDLVLRRLTEALGRDRTRHQVSEVTSLGLVQMTRKRLGTGLLEAFSTTCTCCNGRGIVVHANPVEISSGDDQAGRGDNTKRARRNRRSGKADQPAAVESKPAAHSPAEHPMFRAMASHTPDSETPETETDFEVTETGSEESVDDAARTETDTEDTTSAVSASEGSTAAVEDTAAGSAKVHGDPAPAIESSAAERSASAAPKKSEKSQKPEKSGTSEATSPVDETAHSPATPAAGDTQQSTADEPGQTPPSAPPKRRRAVRRKPAAPTTATDPAVIAEVIASPVTTSGPVGTSTSTEPAVAVRRTPRRRAAGRPAGPPVEE